MAQAVSEIETGDDDDYFRVDVAEATSALFFTTGNLDTYGTLYSESGSWLAENYYGGDGFNFQIAYDLDPGVYYLRVRSFGIDVGSYVVEAAIAPSDDHGDTRETATPLAIGSSQSGVIETGGDVDYFRLDITEATAALFFTTGDFDTYGSLYDESGVHLVSNRYGGDGGNFRIAYDLDPGVYYLRVQGNSSRSIGSYVVEAGFAPPDDHGDTRQTATRLAFGSSRSGEIETFNDVDYFRFEITEATAALLFTTGDLNTAGTLYSQFGVQLTADDAGGAGGNFRIPFDLEPGIYYLSVRGEYNRLGSYVVELRVRLPDDHGDTRQTATPLPFGAALEGKIKPNGDVDYFRLEVAEATVASIRAISDFGVAGELFGQLGDELAYGTTDPIVGALTFKIDFELEPGVYYLRVTGDSDGEGSYVVEARYSPPDDHGDTRQTSTPLAFGATASGEIGSQSDEDYFRLELTEAGEAVLVTTGNFFTDLVLYNEFGSWLTSGDRYIATSLDAGVYFLRVDSAINRRTGSYILEARLGPPDPDDHGDSRETATPLAIGASVSGEIGIEDDGGNDLDYFRLDVTATTEAVLLTSGDLDTRLELYDEFGYWLTSDDQYIAYELESGVYFLRVSSSGNLGSYMVEVRHRVDDHGDTLQSATHLAIGDSLAGEIEFRADEDFFRLDVTQATEVLLSTTSDFDSDFALLDQSGNDVADQQDLFLTYEVDAERYPALQAATGDHVAARAVIAFDLEPGVYYIEVRGDSSRDLGSYVVEAHLRQDDHGNTAGTATPLILGGSQSAAIEFEGDADYFRLEVTEAAEASLYTTGDLDTEGELYDEYGSLLAANDDAGDGYNFRIVHDLAPGVYFLAVTGWRYDTGSYVVQAGGSAAPIQDAGLRAALESALGKVPGEAIAAGEIAALTHLSTSGADIASLSGLEQAVNLRTLSLRSNGISDLGPLSQLTSLEQLELDDNDISDVSPLAGLTNLVELSLARNDVSDVSPLMQMDRLAMLDLAGNAITTLSPLALHTDLRYLDLEANSVSDLRPLENLISLEELYLGGNEISDVSPILALGDLSEVSLWHNPLGEQSADIHIPALRERGVTVLLEGQGLPWLPSGADGVRLGFVRLINSTDEAASLWIYALDEDGHEQGPVGLVVSPNGATRFGALDLADANRETGFHGSIVAGVGDWRVQLYSSRGDVEAFAYMQTPDGLVTSVRDTAPGAAQGVHHVAFFGPTSESDPVSVLRLINPGNEQAEVTITGVDDAGATASGSVRVSMPARASRTLTAQALESGAAPGLTGALGNGQGNWRLAVTSEGDIHAMNLLTSGAGYLMNLSTVPLPMDGVHMAPFFPSASHPTWDGLLRVVNRSESSGAVSIRGFDDSGRAYGPVTLQLNAMQAVQLTASDWENGNAGQGLSSGVGAGQGPWRLELESALDIEALSYIRTQDGMLTPMHDIAPLSCDSRVLPRGSLIRLFCSSGRLFGSYFYPIALFDPANSLVETSRLRLINFGEGDASVHIIGIDDLGKLPGGGVELSIPAGSSREFTSRELESGDEPGVSGSIGDGTGLWELLVISQAPVGVVNLFESPTGHLINLSAAPREIRVTSSAP